MSGCHHDDRRPGLWLGKKTWQEKLEEELDEGRAVSKGERIKADEESWPGGVCGPEEPHTVG